MDASITRNQVTRIQIGTLLVGALAAGFAWALGWPSLVLPILGGVVWGSANVWLLYRLSEYLRPDRDKPMLPLLLIVLVKFPAMYGLAFFLLRHRPVAEVAAAAAGFTLVLVVMVLRAVGAQMARPRAGSVGRA